MKADEELVKRDLQRLSYLDYSFYEGSRKLSIERFNLLGMSLREGDFGSGFNFIVGGDCRICVMDVNIPTNTYEYYANYEFIIKVEDDMVCAIKDNRINISKR